MTIQRKRVAKRLASGLLAGALALGGLAISGGTASAVTPDSPTTNRLAGDDRYETAVEIARTSVFTSADTLVITSGENPYDALAAATLAAAKSAPILLVRSNSIPESVADYVSDVADDIDNRVYIVGGTSAVSEEVADALADVLENATFVRIAGDTRYETAEAIANVSGVMDASDTVILVNGADGRWADALSAGQLAAEEGWPIITTGNGGLNDTAKSAIETYLDEAGSVESFLIIGGPAVMPTSVEDYLLGEGVAPENIRRIGGVDRYQTNLLVNTYILDNSINGALLGSTGGSNIALASGTSPWDAMTAAPWASLSSTAKHIVLVPSPALGPWATALLGAATSLANKPTDIWVIGGKAAVADSVRAAAIGVATSSDVGAPTLTGCTAGSTVVTMTFPKSVGSAGGTQVADNTDEADMFTVTVDGTASTSFDVAASASPFAPATTVYTITLSSGEFVEDDVVEFAGIDEGDADLGNLGFSIAGADCVVSGDDVAPTFSFRAVTTSAMTGPTMILTSSEALEESALEAEAVFSWSTKDATLAASAMGSDLKTWLLTITGDTSDGTYPDEDAVVTIAAEAVEDLAGNSAESDKSATVAADATDPTAVLAGQTCTNTASASSADVGFTVDSKNWLYTAFIGAGATSLHTGPAFNSWKVIVVQQRGLMSPTVVADTAAKKITVTVDDQYHTGDDVVTAAANAGLTGLLGGWTFADGSVSLTQTSASGISLTGGTMTCKLLVLPSEPSGLAAGDVSVTVDGVANGTVNSVTPGSSATYGALIIEVTGISKVGTMIVEIDGLTDVSGNAADSFTLSTTV